MTDLSIIIVSWNVKDLLKKCLGSILKSGKGLDLEIFVVDNASTDGAVEMIKKDFIAKGNLKISLIVNKKNVGFAKANNQGILKSQSRYVLLLNPDTEVLEGCLQNAINFISKNTKIGLL